MKMTNAALTAILLCLSLSTCAAPAQSRSVNRIRIVSNWTGLGPSAREELIVMRNAGDYLADGKKVPDESIANLLAAIDAPAVAKPDPANLGITQEWLDANAEKAFREYAGEYPTREDKNKQARYFSSFKDLKFIERILPGLFNSFHTDDYPTVEIEIMESDRGLIKVSSKAQQMFMLPWIINSSEGELKTYNADIARAIANLMPDNFTNKERLAGKSLGYELAQKVIYEIRNR
jgi:hypothetical protein